MSEEVPVSGDGAPPLPPPPPRPRPSTWTLIRRYIRHAPVTAAFIVACTALFLTVEAYHIVQRQEEGEALRRFGAVTQLMVVRDGEQPTDLDSILHGPFDLWEGEWWRMPLSAFHHAHIVHLGFNVLAFVGLGLMLERRMRWWTYALFFVMACTVSVLPEYLLEHQVVGISGGIAGVFGYLIVLRRNDPWLQMAITRRFIRAFLISLVVCVVLTELNILPIANVAHFAGLGYGWIAGWSATIRGRMGTAARIAFCAAHLALLPGFYYAAHPVWLGRYHWFLAVESEDPQRQIAHLQEALRLEPNLSEAWSDLARVYASQGDFEQAWTAIVRGLRNNGGSTAQVDLARELWGVLESSEDRQGATQILQQILGDKAHEWQNRLKIDPEGKGERGM